MKSKTFPVFDRQYGSNNLNRWNRRCKLEWKVPCRLAKLEKIILPKQIHLYIVALISPLHKYLSEFWRETRYKWNKVKLCDRKVIWEKEWVDWLPWCPSLYIPDFTEQRGEFVVIYSPGHQHLCVVMIECPQLSQATQETGKMLRVFRLINFAQLL